jgi:hypothetical protein
MSTVNLPRTLFASSSIIFSFVNHHSFTHPMFAPIKEKAESLTKQPLPEPFDNRDFGFETERG